MQEQFQTFRYRGHVRSMPKILGGFGAIMCVGLTGAMIFTDAWILSPMIAFLALEFLVLAWFTRRLATTEITLEPEGLHLKNVSRDVRIRYDQIDRIDSTSLPYLGGWARVVDRNGESIRVTVTLEGISRFVAELKRRVDQHNRAAVYSRQALYKFFKTATYCEQSWARLSGRRGGSVVIWVIMLAPVLAIQFFGLGVFVPLMIGFGVWMASEFVFARHIARNADEVMFTAPERDRDLERATLLRAAIAWVAITAPTMALFLLF